MAIDGTDARSVGVEDESGEEEAFVELVEYVRMGVLLVNEELKPVSATSSTAPGADAAVH